MVTRECQQFLGVGFDLRGAASQPEALGSSGRLNTALDYTNTVSLRPCLAWRACEEDDGRTGSATEVHGITGAPSTFSARVAGPDAGVPHAFPFRQTLQHWLAGMQPTGEASTGGLGRFSNSDSCCWGASAQSPRPASRASASMQCDASVGDGCSLTAQRLQHRPVLREHRSPCRRCALSV